MNVSLIITTFNHPNALDLVFETVTRQVRVPDQVVVCDDGSGPETRMLIERWAERLPILHTWQPNRDFRAARSRNLGACRTDSEYAILIDGDCLLPPSFVENHLKLASHGYLVAGGRQLLCDLDTRALLSGVASIDSAFKHWKFRSGPLGMLRDSRSDDWKTVRTCNFGLYRDALDAVGGFDESYLGWGREDSDFVVRLMRIGLKIRSGRLAACVAHLHHAERARNQFSTNDSRFHVCLNNPSQIFSKSSILLES